MKVKDVKKYLDERFPITNAESFDQNAIGLAIGDEDIEVSGIMLTLDLNKEVIKEALENNCNLIISHHPFLFNPIQKVLFKSEKGEVIKMMCENNLSLYSMHTNLDVGCGGVNDVLAKMLGLNEIKIINDEASFGNYLRYGKIEPMRLEDLAKNVKEIFNLSGVRVLGNLNKKITTVGVVGGSGAHPSDIMNAVKAGVDCYITGEVHLNNSQMASFYGLSIIEVNHGVEKFVFNELIKELEGELFKQYNYKGLIKITDVETDKMVTI